MRKYVDNIYYKELSIDNLYLMWKKVKSTCKNKKAIYNFEVNLSTNILSIYNDLYNCTYVPDKYRVFIINEPKKRVVMSQTIRDKIVNHFVAYFYLIKYLDCKLIDSNVATRKGRGSSYADKLMCKYCESIMSNNYDKYYCLKLDISKYFYSINHDILISMLERDIKDNRVINLIKIILSETNKEYINKEISQYDNLPKYEYNTGLSIGAMTSQFLAIYYLNDIDHYIKEVYRCRYYIRYMDDFIILSNDKDKLLYIYKDICLKLNNLKLKINPKSNILNMKNGINFLGYRYIINNKFYIKYRKCTYKRIIKRLRYLYKLDSYKYYKSICSYYGYFKRINNYSLNSKFNLYEYYNNKYRDYFIFIRNKNYYNKIYINKFIKLVDYMYVNNIKYLIK